MEPSAGFLNHLHAGIEGSELNRLLSLSLDREEITGATAEAIRGINRRLSERRAREDLLRALHDTATDLTGIRDVEAVLQAIVQRTRSLSGSDMAYISLNDYERNQTYIRKSDGVTTEAFRTIRMPIGTGVLGKAAAGLSPYQSADYLSDPDIVHLPNIDAIVRDEGVRAILGVPMYLHGSVIGALLIADRSVHSYAATTVDIVDTIGKHAAAALDNAQRFAEITEALEHLGKERTSHISEMVDLQGVISLDERLIETVVGGRGLTGYIDLVHQVLAAKAAVVDPAGGVLASHGEEEAASRFSWPEAVGHLVAEELSDAIGMAIATGKSQKTRVGGGKYTVVPAKAGSTHLATLIINDDIPAEHDGLLQRLSIFLTVLRLFDHAAHDSAQRLQFEVLEDILTGRPVANGQIERRAARFGLRVVDNFTFAVIDSRGADYRRTEMCIRTALGSSAALIAKHETHICVLTNGGHRAVQQIRTALDTASIPATIGYAGAVQGFNGLATVHRQAERALCTLQVLDRSGEILDGTRLGAIGFLLDAANSQAPGYDLLSEIQPLLDYDQIHDTALAGTAWTYLESHLSLAQTAAKLYVHRNTVTQRLARISNLLGDDWLADTRYLDIHLALRIWKLQTNSQ